MHPIQKGSIKGKIFLTQYETAVQKQAKSLDAQAQALLKAGKFGEAYELWHQVIELVPDHSGAEQGLAEVENWLKEKERKRQEILERKQRILLNLYREGQLPSEEFDAAMALIEKSDDELTALERETRRLVDELTDKKISAASYVKSVRLLRKPIEPEIERKVEKAAPMATKSESKKVLEVKPAVLKPKPPVEKAEPDAPKVEPEKVSIPEEKKVFPIVVRHENKKWTVAVSVGLILIVLMIIIMIWPREEQRSELPLTLRKIPTTLSGEQIVTMLAEKNFYASDFNKTGKGIIHNYVEQTLDSDKLVLDKITNLMWQQSGSTNIMTYAEAEKYIRGLNNDNKPFAGLTGWRLPTLEEAMSLMEPQKKNGDLYIDPKFNQNQTRIWTVDNSIEGPAFNVSFYSGYRGYFSNGGSNFVRAVRSVQ